MENLKEILFRKTFEAFKNIQQEKMQWGTETELTLRTFCTLYEVIYAAGLEQEYIDYVGMEEN